MMEVVRQSESAGTADPHELVSSDDEIDYSIKPEYYDPNLDDKDELWAHKQRRGHSSDAVLSCPACFTTLCLDCQSNASQQTKLLPPPVKGRWLANVSHGVYTLEK